MALVIRKGAQEWTRLTDLGDALFTPHHRENATIAATAGELDVRRGGGPAMGSTVDDGQRVVSLGRRLHEQAVLPGTGLRFRRSGGTLAELAASGDFYIAGSSTTPLADPGQAGPGTWSDVVYAAPGLDYSTSTAPAEYAVFEAPTPGYATRTIDISDFGSLPTTYNWSFTASAAPINGLLRVPDGGGPFPLAVFVHGNHSGNENSTPGYVYLMELLASHGILAASVDCNFLNGLTSGENDGRAIVHLEHLRQFQIWNAEAGHALQGKVDLSRIMIVGHSRGGEGVGHASLFNRLASVVPDPGDPAVPLDGSAGLGPYGFSLETVAAIAPTDSQYTPVSGATEVRDNYFVIHGSRDGDVTSFSGQKTYDRAHPIDLADPTQDAEGHKSLLWLIGGNHNHFNSVWGTEGTPTITRAEQENAARVYLGAIAQAVLLGRSGYLGLLRDHHLAWDAGWIPNPIGLVSQYQDPRRIFADHYEHGNPATPSPPVAGSVGATGMSATVDDLSGPSPVYQETHAARVVWNAAGGRYLLDLTPSTLATGAHQRLVLRCGQSAEAQNTDGTLQDFTVTLGDGANTHGVQANGYAELIYPETLAWGGRRVVLQTLRIPLAVFADAGVDVSDIRSIELAFDEPKSGTADHEGSLYIDDIQLSE